jgi:hypothetical protein
MHAFTALMEAYDEGLLGDRTTVSEPPPPPYESIIARLKAIEAKLDTSNRAVIKP